MIHPAAILVAVLLHGAIGLALLRWRQAEPPVGPAFSVELPEQTVVSDQAAAPANSEPPQAAPAPPAPPQQVPPSQPTLPEQVTPPSPPSAAPPQPPPPVQLPKPADIPAAAPSMPEPPLSVPDAAQAEALSSAAKPQQAWPPAPVHRSIAKPRSRPPPPPTAREAQTGAAVTQAPSAAVSISPTWQGSLSAWLLSHRVYPDAARRDGDQGVATLRFTVSRDGVVTGLTLVHSSGSTILDDAALAMLRHARVPAFPPAMTQAGLTVTVPVRYTLER